MKSQFLGSWSPQAAGEAIGNLGRHTRFVGLAKLFLLVFALVLVGALVLIPILEPEEAGLRIAFSGLERSSGPTNLPKMMNPIFQGVDAKNQPYTVAADSAVQEDGDHVLLAAMKADITLAGEKWVALNADQGRLDMKTRLLELAGNVGLFYSDGYEFHTAQAYADMRAGSAMGNSPVTGQGPMGDITAAGFILSRGDKKLTFLGPVKMIIHAGAKI